MSNKKKDKRKENIIREVKLPEGVSASYDGKVFTVKGPKGEIKRVLKQQSVAIKITDHDISFEAGRATKENKKMLGSLAAHAKNMVRGSLQNHIYILKICSGHFPMTVSIADSKFNVKNFLGEKVPRILKLKEGVNVKVEGSLIHISSPSKELAGQVSADIEQLTRRPGFDGRVFQDGIYLTIKDGKELK